MICYTIIIIIVIITIIVIIGFKGQAIMLNESGVFDGVEKRRNGVFQIPFPCNGVVY
jgi:hypothetical protein